ncbi:hypothetical protein [Bradyrhizobium sp. CCGB12]|uniref:hypothetical protein n=1 Tax=Bradyrhizobium sp. CCGB12 TaxID=2949632 RepID=UPI00273C946D|nr:hypothetical protein [Bradyrhizobium sp. CCGB12]
MPLSTIWLVTSFCDQTPRHGLHACHLSLRSRAKAISGIGEASQTLDKAVHITSCSGLLQRSGFDSMQAFVDTVMIGYLAPMDPNDLLAMAWALATRAATPVAISRRALGRIKAKTYVMPVSHDMFFPPSDLRGRATADPG